MLDMAPLRPVIRGGKFTDIPGLLDLIGTAHAESSLAHLGGVNVPVAKKVLQGVMAKHGQATDGGTLVVVADNGVMIEGAFIGLLQRHYFVTDILEATDLFWYARPGAHPRTGHRLLRAWLKWVRDLNVAPVVIRQADSTAIPRTARAGRLLARHGMREIGTIYGKEVTA
jgi:hypothetical protein